tara:strand:- start:3052 stop:4296 length:1245 start_codon:yes stop_codon:yes gene_type:complete
VQVKKIKQLMVLSIKIIGFICLSGIVNAEAQEIVLKKESTIQTSYLDSKNELQDYILDTGDTLEINFVNTPELSGLYSVDEQGELYLNRIKYAYVRGLTINELSKLLEKRYEEFLINPEINIKINTFKPIRVAVKGEVRAPGIIVFPAYAATTPRLLQQELTEKFNTGSNINETNNSTSSNSLAFSTNRNINIDTPSISTSTVKRTNDYVTTLSNALQEAGGLTSYSDVSQISIIREIPIGKGGGKKSAKINFLPYIKDANTTSDIRLFDGDYIFIPSLKEQDPTIIPGSVLSGLSPRFINVDITGKIENPGKVRVPIEGSLSDAMNLSGPRKPLAGKVYLIRYNQDGTLSRKSIKYSANAAPGSDRNPYLIADDIITVQNSLLGRSSEYIDALVRPFIGIYATREVVTNFTGD